MRLLPVFSLIGALLLIRPVLAAEPVVFSTSSVEPWGYFTDRHQPKGLLVTFSQLLQRQMQLNSSETLRFINFIRPYPRVINDIKTGKADFAVLFRSPESLNYGDPVGEVYRFDILVTGLSTAEPIKDLSDLEGKPIGYVRGSKYGPAFDGNTRLTKLSLDSMEKGVEMLKKSRLHALVCLDQTRAYALKQKNIPTAATETLMVLGSASADLYISKRSRHKPLQPLTHKALQDLHQSGDIKAIFNQP